MLKNVVNFERSKCLVLTCSTAVWPSSDRLYSPLMYILLLLCIILLQLLIYDDTKKLKREENPYDVWFHVITEISHSSVDVGALSKP